MIKGNVVSVVDDDNERDYRKVPPSWHVYTFPRSNMTRFQSSKVDDLGLLSNSRFSFKIILNYLYLSCF